MRQLIVLALGITLSACTTTETSRRVAPEMTMPPMATFKRVSPTPPVASNAIIARDFLDLAFTLENGTDLPVFTRFDGPVTVKVAGKAPPTLGPDLDRLLKRLRDEAHITISRVSEPVTAAITIIPIPSAQIRKVAPTAACFVRANVSSWEEYRARRNDPDTFWNSLRQRTRMAVFVPTDVSPQETRDCLHEEIAQALGPVNDLYRLNDSIFNDDNFHTVLTGYDMLILATHYDRTLKNGMTRAEVAGRLPGILNRLNPRGRSLAIAGPRSSSRAWVKAINTATTPRLSKTRRKGAAERAVALAALENQSDANLAYSYYILGRLSLSTDPNKALDAFLVAGRIYQSRPETRVQEAHVSLQVAAFQLAAGHADIAVALVNQNLATVRRSEHAALLSLMLLVKAEGLEILGDRTQAAQVQKEALAWARYGYGSEAVIRERVSEILSISPRNREG